jgi:hypothetical protein
MKAPTSPTLVRNTGTRHPTPLLPTQQAGCLPTQKTTPTQADPVTPSPSSCRSPLRSLNTTPSTDHTRPQALPIHSSRPRALPIVPLLHDSCHSHPLPSNFWATPLLNDSRHSPPLPNDFWALTPTPNDIQALTPSPPPMTPVAHPPLTQDSCHSHPPCQRHPSAHPHSLHNSWSQLLVTHHHPQ